MVDGVADLAPGRGRDAVARLEGVVDGGFELVRGHRDSLENADLAVGEAFRDLSGRSQPSLHSAVVPAKAGTHNHRTLWSQRRWCRIRRVGKGALAPCPPLIDEAKRWARFALPTLRFFRLAAPAKTRSDHP